METKIIEHSSGGQAMTQEEKAKAYDEAIEKARSLHDNYDSVSTLIDIKEELEHIFPELAESEDERIRKALAEGLCDVTGELGWSDFGGIPIEEIQDWLEKQGEQKHTEEAIGNAVMDYKKLIEAAKTIVRERYDFKPMSIYLLEDALEELGENWEE